MGLFVYTQKGSIISTVDLPTTEIIEPIKYAKVPRKSNLGTFTIFIEIRFCLSVIYPQPADIILR
ncbi:DNA polymerase IV [Streptococcus suis]|nr:DNA polymerase IV [Streptococcus suis]